MSKPQMALYTKVLNPLIVTKKNSTINYSNSKKLDSQLLNSSKFQESCFVTRRQEEEGDIILGENIDFNIHRALVKEEQDGGRLKSDMHAKRLDVLLKKEKLLYGVI